ncbi:MAG: CPBP family intramembrane metalloprotease [Clostridia bacterium]|nr:CPBP family intramembrane metalloprotease [Clostridia bacterium]
MEELKLTVKDSSLSFVVGFIFCQFAALIVTTLIFFFITLLGLPLDQSEAFITSAWGYLFSTIGLDGALLAIFLFFNKNKNNSILHKPTIKKSILYILLAILSFFALYPIITIIDIEIIKLGFKPSSLPYDLNTTNYFISIVSLVILPAIMEELLFRGIIARGLKKHGKTFSIIISAIMFSIFHMSISQTIYPLLIGLVLAVVMYNEENIIYPILIHATNNLLSLTLQYFELPLYFDHWTYILIAVVLAVIFLSTVIYFMIKGNKNSKQIKLSTKDKIFLTISLVFMIIIWIAYNIANILL